MPKVKSDVIVAYIGTEQECIERQMKRIPFVNCETHGKEKIIDFCIGKSYDEAARVLKKLYDLGRIIESGGQMESGMEIMH